MKKAELIAWIKKEKVVCLICLWMFLTMAGLVGIESKIERLSRDVRTIKNYVYSISDIESDVSDIASTVSNIESDVSSIGYNISDLESKVRSIESDVSRILRYVR